MAIRALLLGLVICPSILRADDKPAVSLTSALHIPGPRALDGIENLYGQLAWHPVTQELAATTMNGPWAFIVDPRTGAHRTLQVRAAGSDFRLAWLPRSRILATSSLPHSHWVQWRLDGTQVERTDRAGAIKVSSLNASAYQGLLVPGVGEAWLMAGNSPEPGGEHRGRIALHVAGTAEPVRTWDFPEDGTRYRIEASTAAVRAGELIVAVFANHLLAAEPANPATQGWEARWDDDVWIVNMTRGQIECRLKALERRRDPWGNVGWRFRAMALSPDGKRLALSSTGAFDVFDTATCGRERRLQDHYKDDSGSRWQLAFTADGRYLVGVGPDVRVEAGGWLEVWRAADWQPLVRRPEEASYSLATHPKDRTFALGRIGRIDLYSISGQ